MRNAHPRCSEAVVGLANRVRSKELNKLMLAVSYTVLVPLVDGIRPLQEIREWDQRVSILLNLIEQLSLGLLEALPTQLQLVIHQLIINLCQSPICAPAASPVPSGPSPCHAH
jgi:hypothetical protein